MAKSAKKKQSPKKPPPSKPPVRRQSDVKLVKDKLASKEKLVSKEKPVAKEPEPTTNCSICLDTSRCRKLKTLRCGHEFHERCVGKWLEEEKMENICPLCRETI